MANPTTPEQQPVPERKPTPGQGEDKNFQQQDTEVNPARQGNKTEVDLDKSKTKTFDDKDQPLKQ